MGKIERFEDVLNISEGFARKTDKEFARFLFVAHGSVAEVQLALYVALDQSYVDQQTFERLYADCTEISKVISGLIKYLKGAHPKVTQQTLDSKDS